MRRLGHDERGSVAVLFALVSTLLFIVTAIALDLVTIWIARRNAQGAADLAAILAASDLSNAGAKARRSLSDNGYGAVAESAVVTSGTYLTDVALAIDDRFKVTSSTANSVRVAFTPSVATTFSRIVGLPSVFELRTTATARVADFAAFTVGSGLAGLEAGIVNAILGSLTGRTVSLGVADYNALATARIDAFRYLDALVASGAVKVADYDQVLAANVTLAQALGALSVNLPGGTATKAVDGLLKALAGTGGSVPVASLVDLGEITLPASPARQPGPGINPLATVTNAIAIANGKNQVSVDLGPSIPGILGTRLVLAIGERKQSSGFVQPGSAKATVRTSQVRVLIQADVNLAVGSVTLPIYIEAARGTATLSSVVCPWSDSSRRSVAIDARPGVVDLAIAAVPTSAIDLAYPSPGSFDPARLVTLPLLAITGSARTSWDAPYSQRLVFTNDDILTGRTRSVSSTQAVTSLTSSLIDKMRLEINGIDLVGALGVQRTLKPAFEAIAPSLDRVIDTTLRTFGIHVGFADVSVDSTQCGHAALVQ